MRKTTTIAILFMVIIGVVIVSGCLQTGNQTVTTTITSTKTAIFIKTSITTEYITTTETTTVVSTFTKSLIDTVLSVITSTVTQEKTVFVTITTCQQNSETTQTSNSSTSNVLRGPAIIREGNPGVTVNNNTTTVYLPGDYYEIFTSYVSMYFTSNTYGDVSVFKKLGFTDDSWKSNAYAAARSAMIMQSYFEYDEYKSEYGEFTTLNPVELYSKRSGICGDFAAFYMMFLSYNSEPVTLFAIYFDSYSGGHAFVAKGTTAFENQYMFENLRDVLNYWYYASGPYTAYMLILSGTSIGTSMMVVTSPMKTFRYTGVDAYIINGAKTITFTGDYYVDSMSVSIMVGTIEVMEIDFNNGVMTFSESSGVDYTTIEHFYDFWSYFPAMYLAPMIYPEYFAINVHGTYLYVGDDEYYIYTRNGYVYRGIYMDGEDTYTVEID